MTTNQRFEWDEEKEKINIQKHKLDFATAARVFFDPYLHGWRCASIRCQTVY